jgi:hypothetical protein
MPQPLAISRLDQHAIVDEYWKAKLNALDESSPMHFYDSQAILMLWRDDKTAIDLQFAVPELF